MTSVVGGTWISGVQVLHEQRKLFPSSITIFFVYFWLKMMPPQLLEFVRVNEPHEPFFFFFFLSLLLLKQLWPAVAVCKCCCLKVLFQSLLLQSGVPLVRPLGTCSSPTFMFRGPWFGHARNLGLDRMCQNKPQLIHWSTLPGLYKNTKWSDFQLNVQKKKKKKNEN